MCFSAEASLAGGVVISTIGVFTVREVHKPSQIVFASIPLFFGLQQITEGLLWVALPNPDLGNLQHLCTYIFLIMADVLWPMLIPFSVLLMEKNKKKKRILRIFLLMGIAVSIYYAFCLVSFNVMPQIKYYHIEYNTDFPKLFGILAFAVYLMVTVTPLFISSIQRTHLLGVLMLMSCVVTIIFYEQFLTSVWCFFAAFMSGIIYWIMRDAKKKFNIEILLGKE